MVDRKHVDEENLKVEGDLDAPRDSLMPVAGGVTVVVTQAFGPDGENLIDDKITFDGHPAVTLKVRAGDKEGLVYLSPVHGDRRKSGFTDIPAGNSKPFVNASARTRILGPVVRGGAAAGQFLPPSVWRRLSRPLIGQLHQRGNPARPRLTPEQREALLGPFLPDIELLEQVTGQSFDDWRTHRDGDSFHTRSAQRVGQAG